MRRTLSHAKWRALVRVQQQCPSTWVSYWSRPVCFNEHLLVFTAYLSTTFNSQLHKVASFFLSPYPCSPCMKPRERSQSPKYGGHDGPRLSDSPGRSRCLCTRLLLQLRTGTVSRADLPPGRTEDLLPRLRIGEGKRKPRMLAHIVMNLFGRWQDTDASMHFSL